MMISYAKAAAARRHRDGVVRDLHGLQKLTSRLFPRYQANGPYKNGPGEINVPCPAAAWWSSRRHLVGDWTGGGHPSRGCRGSGGKCSESLGHGAADAPRTSQRQLGPLAFPQRVEKRVRLIETTWTKIK